MGFYRFKLLLHSHAVEKIADRIRVIQKRKVFSSVHNLILKKLRGEKLKTLSFLMFFQWVDSANTLLFICDVDLDIREDLLKLSKYSCVENIFAPVMLNTKF